MNTSRKLICPIIAVWVIFILNLFINYFYFITLKQNIFDFHENYYGYIRYNGYNRYSGYRGFIFFSLLINFLIELTASILISLSFEKKKQRLYLIGLIMSLIFCIYMTIFYIIAFINEYKNIINYYRETEKRLFIFNNIFQILLQWSQFGVLIIYFNKVKQSFNQSYLNPVLITDFPNQIQPREYAEEPI